MNATEILSALRNPSIPMTSAEITEAWNVLRTRHSNNASLAVRSFSFGDKVQFTGRNGVMLRGTVTKTNQKTVSVRTDAGNEWRVAPAILSAVA